jgi:hypothetical protein
MTEQQTRPDAPTGFDNGMVALEGADLRMIGELLTLAADTDSVVLVAIDGGLKLKADNGTWSPPVGLFCCLPCAQGYHVNHRGNLADGCTVCSCAWLAAGFGARNV